MGIPTRLVFAIILAMTFGHAEAQSPETARIYAGAKPYMNEPTQLLKAELRDLDDLKIDPDQASLPEILRNTASVIMAQIPRVPNLVAKEDIAAEQLPQAASFSSNRRNLADTLPISSDGRMVPQDWTHFEYIILAEHDPNGGTLFKESRKQLGMAYGAATPHGIGFASLWLLFVHSNQPESHFRYLGTQLLKKRPTFVIAFAQDPSIAKNPGIIEARTRPIPLLYQGIAWIDASTFHIVRIRTDLLAPLPQIQLRQVTSTADFAEVRIPKLDTPLWLPKDVEITWDLNGNRSGELHRYFAYRLFRATATILPN